MNKKDNCSLNVKDINKIVDSQLFKIMGEPIRVEILRFLTINGPSDVGTIAKNFPQDRSVISRHLKIMYEYGLLFCEKESRRTIYAMNGFEFLHKMEDIVENIKKLLSQVCPDEIEKKK